MSQYDFGTIDADEEDGTELAALLGDWRDALNSNHRGSTRPDYVVAGMHWVKTVSGTAEQLLYYDGANDLLLATYNPTAHTIVVNKDALPAADTTNAGAVVLNDTTGVLTGSDASKAVTADALAALWEDGGNVSAISAGVVTLGEGGSFNLITSTATITKIQFATQKTGRRAKVRFNTIRQLTHSSDLTLPAAGSDIVTAVGDIAEVEDRGGGTARINEYTRANGTALATTASIPTGAVTAFAGSSAPAGFLLCDGSAASRTTYAALFSAIGTTFGAGNGSTTFNLPDLRGRVVAGVDGSANRLTNAASGGLDGNTLGATGGEEAHQLTVAELASHQHAFTAVQASGSSVGGGGFGASASSTNTSAAGSGNAHNNVQPTIILNYIIKT